MLKVKRDEPAGGYPTSSWEDDVKKYAETDKVKDEEKECKDH